MHSSVDWTPETEHSREAEGRVRRRERARQLIEGLSALTGLPIDSASPGRLPRRLLDREVPDPALLVRTFRNHLAPRTHNALWQHEPGLQGRIWTVADLLTIRGFGVYCLLDLLTVLVRHDGIARHEGPGQQVRHG
jgi:hypothetical protein